MDDERPEPPRESVEVFTHAAPPSREARLRALQDAFTRAFDRAWARIGGSRYEGWPRDLLLMRLRWLRERPGSRVEVADEHAATMPDRDLATLLRDLDRT